MGSEGAKCEMRRWEFSHATESQQLQLLTREIQGPHVAYLSGCASAGLTSHLENLVDFCNNEDRAQHNRAASTT